jgi:peptidoglycan/LPS O-acetylase OafA/YrhL
MHARSVQASKRRFHQLDGLRAVAVLLVLVHHSASSTVRDTLALHRLPMLGTLLFRTTASGVELFFVLSGVVLLRPYLRGERPLDVAVYARRRLERIAPPYLAAWLLAGAVTALATALPSWFSAHLAHFTWRAWLSQAFVLRFTDVLYNEAWWSLAVEVLFYFVAPLVVLACSARRLHAWQGLVALAVAAAGASALMAAVTVDHLPLAMLYSLGAYASCFCGGVLVARFDLSRRATAILVAVGLAWIATAAWLPWLNFHVGYGLLYTGVVQRVIAADGRRILASDIAVWLGERSYSLFLVHVSVFQLVDHAAALVMPGRSAAFLVVTRLVGIPGAFLTAMALFTLVERRFARGLVTAESFWPPHAHAPEPAAVKSTDAAPRSQPLG